MPNPISPENLKIYKSLFRGREDVFAIRWEKEGKTGYVPAYNLNWNETIKQFFNEDDLLLFNYLFSSESGLNLRNNVAHCFYNYEEYTADQMFL